MNPGFTARIAIIGLTCGAAVALAWQFQRTDGRSHSLIPLEIGMAAGLVLFAFGFRLLRNRRLIQNIPTSKIRSMAMGLVEVKGRATDPVNLQAPFSGEPCVYYKVQVDEYKRSGDHSRWVNVFSRNTDDLPFNLSDETGCTSVRPQGAEILLDVTFSFENRGRGVPSKVVWFLKERNFSIDGFAGMEKNLRFTERVIRPGQDLYVMGECRSEKDRLSGAARDRVLEALRTAKSDPERMKTFDKDRDGTISAEEWEEARSGITREAVGALEVEGTCLMKPASSGGVFIISDKDEKNLTGRFGWGAFGGVFGGIALFGVCLFLLLRATGRIP
jgi:hypothetical protein